MRARKVDIQKLDRLKKRSDFLSAQAAGMKWVSKTMIVQIAAKGGDECRFGLTVSKKISKSAVIRNRIRRRLRAAARDVLPDNGQKGWDYVLIGRKEAETVPYQSLVNDLSWCLRRLSREHSDKKVKITEIPVVDGENGAVLDAAAEKGGADV